MSLGRCHECNFQISSRDPVVTCSGFCKNDHQFHAVCVGLSVDEGLACNHPNILWICNPCRGKLVKRSRTIPAAFDQPDNEAIISINEKIVKMQQSIDDLAQHFNGYGEASKAIEQPEDLGNLQAIGHSSPLTSTKLDASENSQQNADCSLFVSNIANDVTNDEVLQMVNETIGLDDVISVKCLVPPWKDKSSLDYISFKVVVKLNQRDPDLKVFNWPKGIRCREFIDRSNETWRPARGIV